MPPSVKTLRLSVLEFSYNVSRWLVVTIENAYAATAHAPNQVTHEYGVKNNYILESQTPICLFTMQIPWLYDESNKSYLRK